MGDEGSADPTPLKRARTGDLKRVAEIVMVLSAMGEMRGGKDPTAAEKALVAEAREKLTGICEKEFKPKDLIPKEAVRVLVEDLGLNRSRDPMMGFRPSKMSIGERLLHTKRKVWFIWIFRGIFLLFLVNFGGNFVLGGRYAFANERKV